MVESGKYDVFAYGAVERRADAQAPEGKQRGAAGAGKVAALALVILAASAFGYTRGNPNMPFQRVNPAGPTSLVHTADSAFGYTRGDPNMPFQRVNPAGPAAPPARRAVETTAEVTEVESAAMMAALFNNCECGNNATCDTVNANVTEGTLFQDYTCANTNGPCFDYSGTFRETVGDTGFCRHVVGDDECHGHVCTHGGQCADLDGAFKCKCRPGWIGDHCEHVQLSNYVVYFTARREKYIMDPIMIRFMGPNGDVSKMSLLTRSAIAVGENVTVSVMARDVGTLERVQIGSRPGLRYALDLEDFNVAVGPDIYHVDEIKCDGMPGTIIPLLKLAEE